MLKPNIPADKNAAPSGNRKAPDNGPGLRHVAMFLRLHQALHNVIQHFPAWPYPFVSQRS
jgi:hypothetical protein